MTAVPLVTPATTVPWHTTVIAHILLPTNRRPFHRAVRFTPRTTAERKSKNGVNAGIGHGDDKRESHFRILFSRPSISTLTPVTDGFSPVYLSWSAVCFLSSNDGRVMHVVVTIFPVLAFTIQRFGVGNGDFQCTVTFIGQLLIKKPRTINWPSSLVW